MPSETPILQRLTPTQVLSELEANTKVFVRLPLFDKGNPRIFRLDDQSRIQLIALLTQDPDPNDAETFFYLDFDHDLLLDPSTKF